MNGSKGLKLNEAIEYELRLPATKAGERLAKTVGRILKHTYSAKRLRVQHSKDDLVISAQVDRLHLEAIRGAVNMSMMAKRMEGKLDRGRAKQFERVTVDGAEEARPA
jgi:hypothetical protein